ncbi:MAG: hypothetical protein IJC50_03835 [Clostridia bacterium]|nr:hypothetical protein [Clostridia bacterium]
MNQQNEKRSKRSVIIIILTAVVILGAAAIIAQCLLFGSASDKHPYLSAGDWFRTDETIGENLNITFTEDGEYSYSCDCGEPVGNSDVYDSYKYDAKKGIIKLSGPDGEKSEAKLVYCDQFYLCLVIDGSFTVFKNEKNLPEDQAHESAERYVPANAPLLAVLEFDSENKSLTVAPFNYDGDSRDLFEDAITDLEFSKNLDFYDVSVVEENGEAKVTKSPVMPYKYDLIGEDYTGGYITFDDEGRVTGAIFYGELIIQ